MATTEVPPSSSAAQSISVTSVTQDYSRPLAIVTTLFFMWGFLTCLNDILVPHLKAIFDLNFAGPVCILLGLLFVLRAMVENRE
jgi:FHS family L-fucose permease-like MFS transporter